MEKDVSLRQSVFKNSIWNIIMNLSVKIGSLIFTIILARFLLPEKFGIYGLAMSIIIIFITFADMGANQTIIRYLSDSLGKKDKQLSQKYYNYLFKIKIYFTLLFSTLLLISAYPLSLYIFKKLDLFPILLILSFYLIVLSFEQFYQYIFYAFKKVKYITIKESILQLTRIFGVLFVFIFISSRYHLVGTAVTLVLSSVIALIYFLYNLKKIAPFIFNAKSNFLSNEEKTKIKKFLAYSAVGNISIKIFGHIDIIMIGFFLTANYVGYYNAAFTLIYGLASLISIELILIPAFTQIKEEKISYSFNLVLKYFSIISIPLIFGSLLVGKYVIRIMYGYDYLKSVYPFYILAFLIFLGPLSGTLKSLFSAREKPNYFLLPTISTSVLNIVLNYFFISYFLKISGIWAISGAAFATLISRTIFFFYLLNISTKKLNLKPNFKMILKPILSSLIMSVTLFILFYNLPDMNLFLGISEIFIGASVYFLIMIVIKGIEKEDFIFLRNCLLKR